MLALNDFLQILAIVSKMFTQHPAETKCKYAKNDRPQLQYAIDSHKCYIDYIDNEGYYVSFEIEVKMTKTLGKVQ